jgi:hypothetical protein
MAGTAIKSDFTNGAGGKVTPSDDIFAVRVVRYYTIITGGSGEPDQHIESVGKDGLCNEPLYDKFRADGGSGYPTDAKKEKEYEKSKQWGCHCGANGVQYLGCYFLLCSPDFGAPNLHIRDEEGETTEHITSRSISKSGNPQRTTSSGLVNYPYQTIQLEADGEWHTYEVLHATIHAKRIQGFRDLGYQIKQDPNRSYEYKRKIRSTLTDDIELAKNKGAWDSSYGFLNSKQALELAGDY